MLTVERLKEVLSYDPATGIFNWKIASNGRIKVGQVAGSPNEEGYLRIKIDRKLYAASHLAVLYMEGSFPPEHVDHINHEVADNRWGNLRKATCSQNCRNQGKRKNNTSGYKGVSWQQGKWKAAICVYGQTIHLGVFSTPEEAHQAYTRGVATYHGSEFGRAI